MGDGKGRGMTALDLAAGTGEILTCTAPDQDQ
jgi:ubiquinone/menaquinone biosynthesis C-methylase UbiE